MLMFMNAYFAQILIVPYEFDLYRFAENTNEFQMWHPDLFSVFSPLHFDCFEQARFNQRDMWMNRIENSTALVRTQVVPHCQSENFPTWVKLQFNHIYIQQTDSTKFVWNDRNSNFQNKCRLKHLHLFQHFLIQIIVFYHFLFSNVMIFTCSCSPYNVFNYNIRS